MSDCFQVLVDPAVSIEEAPAAADKVLQFLFQRGIVGSEESLCILGGEVGYPPGPNAPSVCQVEGLRFRPAWKDGLEVTVRERYIFDAGGAGLQSFCRKCGIEATDEPAWLKALGDWAKKTGTGVYTCAACGHIQLSTELTFEPQWGFGNLGFTFWNWPPLKAAFVEEVSQLLQHRIILVRGVL